MKEVILIKSLHVIMTICLASLVLSGCGAHVSSPLTGVFYTNVQGPVAATGKSGGVVRSGSASTTSILGLVATGDASIRAAARNGGITEIHWVDYHSESTLGIFAKYTVIVYGTSEQTVFNDALPSNQLLTPTRVPTVKPNKESKVGGNVLTVFFIGCIVAGLYLVISD